MVAKAVFVTVVYILIVYDDLVLYGDLPPLEYIVYRVMSGCAATKFCGGRVHSYWLIILRDCFRGELFDSLLCIVI